MEERKKRGGGVRERGRERVEGETEKMRREGGGVAKRVRAGQRKPNSSLAGRPYRQKRDYSHT